MREREKEIDSLFVLVIFVIFLFFGNEVTFCFVSVNIIFLLFFSNQGNCFSTLNGITSHRSRSCLCLFVVPCSSLTILTTKLAEIGELIGTEIPALMHLNYNTTDGSLLIVRRERYPDDEKK